MVKSVTKHIAVIMDWHVGGSTNKKSSYFRTLKVVLLEAVIALESDSSQFLSGVPPISHFDMSSRGNYVLVSLYALYDCFCSASPDNLCIW